MAKNISHAQNEKAERPHYSSELLQKTTKANSPEDYTDLLYMFKDDVTIGELKEFIKRVRGIDG